MKAVWNGEVVAETDDTVVVEGNHYFPAGSLKKEYFSPNDQKTTCHWKGEASYYDVSVNRQQNKGAANCAGASARSNLAAGHRPGATQPLSKTARWLRE